MEDNSRYLFRGKSIRTNEWKIGFPAHCYAHSKGIDGIVKIDSYVEDFCFHGEVEEIIQSTLGQSTGLRDKNGTLIFEDDILTLDNKYHPDQGYESTVHIVYDNNKNGWYYRYPLKKDRGHTGLISAKTPFTIKSYEFGKYAHIIGNIHDTPSLLQSEQEDVR